MNNDNNSTSLLLNRQQSANNTNQHQTQPNANWLGNRSSGMNQPQQPLVQNYRNNNTLNSSSYSSPVQSSFNNQKPVGKNFKIDDGEAKCVRVFGFKIGGNPAAFAANPEKAKYFMASKYSAMYRKGSAAVGSQRHGDPTKAIYFEAHLKWVRNTFPYDILLQSNHFRGNCYTGSKKRGFWICPALSNKKYNRQIYFPHKFTYGKMLRTYYNISEDHLKAPGPFPDPKDPKNKYYMVAVGSHIYGVLADNQNNSDQPYNLRQMHVNGAYAWVPENLYTSAACALKQKVLARMPQKDMLKLHVKITPAFCNWSDPIYTCGSVKQEEMRRRYYELSGAIEISFRVHGH